MHISLQPQTIVDARRKDHRLEYLGCLTLAMSLVGVVVGSKNDNFDKSMCTKAKNPFCVLPLVTQNVARSTMAN